MERTRRITSGVVSHHHGEGRARTRKAGEERCEVLGLQRVELPGPSMGLRSPGPTSGRSCSSCLRVRRLRDDGRRSAGTRMPVIATKGTPWAGLVTEGCGCGSSKKRLRWRRDEISHVVVFGSVGPDGRQGPRLDAARLRLGRRRRADARGLPMAPPRRCAARLNPCDLVRRVTVFQPVLRCLEPPYETQQKLRLGS